MDDPNPHPHPNPNPSPHPNPNPNPNPIPNPSPSPKPTPSPISQVDDLVSRVLGGGVRERWGGRLEPVRAWVGAREDSAELGAFFAFSLRRDRQRAIERGCSVAALLTRTLTLTLTLTLFPKPNPHPHPHPDPDPDPHPNPP